MSEIPWVRAYPKEWAVKPFRSVFRESRQKNSGMIETNLLSLSFGRIIRKDIASDEGLLPESFETYQVVEPDSLVFRFTDMQNDQRSLRTARATERGIITSAYGNAIAIGIYPRFAEYLLRSYDTTKVFYAFGGGVRQSLKLKDVERLPVLIPPPDEQRAIADYLDRETAQIDALIAKQEQLIATLRERRRAVVDVYFSTVRETRALRHSLTRVDQGVSPQADSEPVEAGSGVGVLRSGCVNRGRFQIQENKRLASDFVFDRALLVRDGDIIVSRASGSPDLVGSTARARNVDRDVILSDKLFRLTPRSDTDPSYLTWFMNSRRYRDQVALAISGAAGLANNLPLSQLRGFQVPIAPLEQQRSIVAELDAQTAKIDTLLEKAEQFIALAKERRAALITAAVTGQIAVPGFDPNDDETTKAV